VSVRSGNYDRPMIRRRLPTPEAAFVAFAASFAVFQHVPSFIGRAGTWLDLVTPFVVIGTAALVLLTLRAAPAAIVLALVGGVIYVNGHGLHLSANAIGHEEIPAHLEDTIHFWDELFGHIWWHLGWIVLIAAIVLAEGLSRTPRRWRPPSWALAAVAALLLGVTLFTSGVEGGTWWMVYAATAVFVVWAVRAPRPLLVTTAGAFVLAALLLTGWAIWHGGMPEFSDVGLL
jgi:hypothetical protein